MAAFSIAWYVSFPVAQAASLMLSGLADTGEAKLVQFLLLCELSSLGTGLGT